MSCFASYAKSIAFQEVKEADPDHAEKVFLEVDGTGIPMRPEESEGRTCKGDDGVARTSDGKVLVASRSNDETVRYDDGIEPVTSKLDEPTFTEHFLRFAKLTGFDKAKHKVLLSNGAE